MARYRKISTTIWGDEKFRSLSLNGKIVFLFLLTHPNMTSLGAMRGTVGGLALEFPDLTPEAFREGFAEAFRKAMVKVDSNALLVLIPSFIKHNLPQSPNVIRGWRSCLDVLPECELLSAHLAMVERLVQSLSKDFMKAFKEAFPKALPKAFPMQEQEQEQEQEQNQVPPLPPAGGSEGMPAGNACVVPDPAKPPRRKPRAEPIPPLPDRLAASPEFVAAWDEYVAHRAEMKKPLTPRAITAILNKIARWRPETCADALRESVANGWQGVFEPRDGQAGGGRGGGRRGLQIASDAEFEAEAAAKNARLGPDHPMNRPLTEEDLNDLPF